MLSLLGALALTYLTSRLFLNVPRRWNGNMGRLAAAHLASLALFWLLLAWKMDMAVLPWLYILTQGLWLTIDLLRLRRGFV